MKFKTKKGMKFEIIVTRIFDKEIKIILFFIC